MRRLGFGLAAALSTGLQMSENQYPKWVDVHSSHLGIDPHGKRIPLGFDDHHWDRVARKFAVLVNDASEEQKAGKPKE